MAKSKDFHGEKTSDRLVLWNVRLPEALLARLRERAAEMDRSASWLVRHLITEGLARKKSIT